ncbi:luciferase-like domain-containing protein [Lasiosphaeria ovina]|uniref:Luciferase-like domain-containing protein n=1 Tax=Lasiosphaeria ovina TaxID=92902 RepID=A0AAE0KBD2_9PEZI|nr:luciferase-like domain-containing protein [Lasiosphaeria ovina]
MPTEFISLTFPNASTELAPIPGASIDPDFQARYARTLDEYGFNYTLVPYDSSYYDPWTQGATIAAHTKNLKVIIALRPNTVYPTVAAKMLATLSQLSRGRAVVHFIAGGSDVEQAREGDFLSKDERYARLADYIRILRRAWASPEPFDWASPYYTFTNFRNLVRPYGGATTVPVSVGGSSDAAYAVGGQLADIFGLWGEPLADTKQQIDRIYGEAEKAGRPRAEWPRIWVTFRPIVAETDDLAWAKAHRTLDLLKTNKSPYGSRPPPVSTTAAAAPKEKEEGVPFAAPPGAPQNAGSQRLLAIAARGDVQDRALWYPTVTATGARGASTALVGSYQTVADSILDYVDLGCELISIRGYDNFNDAVDYGRFVLPLVREGLVEREGRAKEEVVVAEPAKAEEVVAVPTNGEAKEVDAVAETPKDEAVVIEASEVDDVAPLAKKAEAVVVVEAAKVAEAVAA